MVAFQLQIGSIDPESIPFGVDMHFLQLAQSENKKIVEVESISRQIAAFEAMNEDIVLYITSLLDALDKDENDDDSIDIMLQA